MFKSKTIAFTLAEVLLTLTIIGVVAALTIPGLKETSDRSANVTALQKAYSTATNAFSQLQAEYGPTLFWVMPDNNSLSASFRGQRLFSMQNDRPISWLLQQKMNVMKSTGIPSADYQVKKLSGENLGTTEIKIDNVTLNLNSKNAGVAFQTADGMYWLPSHVHLNCAYTKKLDGNDVNICGHLMVDTNGPKGPNRMGIDIFFFDITLDGVVPYIAEKDDCQDMSGNGYSCAAKVLKGDDHALDFIYE